VAILATWAPAELVLAWTGHSLLHAKAINASLTALGYESPLQWTGPRATFLGWLSLPFTRDDLRSYIQESLIAVAVPLPLLLGFSWALVLLCRSPYRKKTQLRGSFKQIQEQLISRHLLVVLLSWALFLGLGTHVSQVVTAAGKSSPLTWADVGLGLYLLYGCVTLVFLVIVAGISSLLHTSYRLADNLCKRS